MLPHVAQRNINDIMYLLMLPVLLRMDGLIGSYGGVSDEEEMEFEQVPKTEEQDEEETENDENGKFQIVFLYSIRRYRCVTM